MCCRDKQTPRSKGFRSQPSSQMAVKWQNNTRAREKVPELGGMGRAGLQREWGWRHWAQMGVLVLPGINPEDALLQVVDGEPVGPASRARLLVDGAPARTAHGGSLDAGQAGIPVCPEKDPARDSEQAWSARGHQGSVS